MSFWAHVGVVIKDTDLFERACNKFDILFDKQSFRLLLPTGREVGRLEETESGRRLYMDTDIKWSPLARIIGSSGEKLMQEYSRNVIDRQLFEMGGLITNEEIMADGTIKLHVEVGGV